MAERLSSAGENIALYRCHVDEIREQDINARVMPPEMFDRLTENIKRENRLESLPFAIKRPKFFELVSGHHRLRAARAAGMTEIFLLVDEREDLSNSAVRAKQLAHNRIAGKDDDEILQRIFAEIESVDDLLESGFSEADFDDLKQLEAAKVMDVAALIDWRTLNLMFLPETVDNLDAITKIVPKVDKKAESIGVVSLEVFDRFKTACIELGRTEDIRSMGAIVSMMAEITLAHLKERADGEKADNS